MIKNFLLLLVVCITPSLLSNEYVAVADFEGINVAQKDAKALTQKLISEMIEIGVYQILERSEIEKILQEQQLQHLGLGCSEKQCAVEIGEIIGARYIVLGSISKIGSSFSIDARLISVETGESYNSATFSYIGSIETLLLEGMESIANQLSNTDHNENAAKNKKYVRDYKKFVVEDAKERNKNIQFTDLDHPMVVCYGKDLFSIPENILEDPNYMSINDFMVEISSHYSDSISENNAYELVDLDNNGTPELVAHYTTDINGGSDWKCVFKYLKNNQFELIEDFQESISENIGSKWRIFYSKEQDILELLDLVVTKSKSRYIFKFDARVPLVYDNGNFFYPSSVQSKNSIEDIMQILRFMKKRGVPSLSASGLDDGSRAVYYLCLRDLFLIKRDKKYIKEIFYKFYRQNDVHAIWNKINKSIVVKHPVLMNR